MRRALFLNRTTGSRGFIQLVRCTLVGTMLVLLPSQVPLYGQQGVLTQKHFSTAAISMDQSGRYPSIIEFTKGDQPTLGEFLAEFRTVFSVPLDDEMRVATVNSDELGGSQHRFKQHYKGIEVFGGEYVLHVEEGLVRSAIGRLVPDLDLDPEPVVREPEALQRALEYIGSAKYMWQDTFWEKDLKERTKREDTTYFPKGVLCWAPSEFGAARTPFYQLAYRFDIYSSSPTKAERIFVDAKTGEFLGILPLESNCSSATVNTIFNGSRTIFTDKYTATNYRLRDNCQTATIRIRDWNSTTTTASPVEIENTTNTWTTTNERFGGTVLWETKMSYTYFLNVHGRASYDNANGNVEGYINAVFGCTPPPTPCYYTDNASMSFSGGTMKVGLGSSGTLQNSWSTLDIIAHEYTHAVTGSSSGLVYSNESGALNESFSDIFGEAIENYVLSSNDWLVGDDRTSGAIRSLSNPKTYGDPDTYLGTNWYTGTGDYGGVHTNSGVQNKWFHLLTQGGSGTNDNGWTYSFSGIGLSDARAIAFRNLTVKLTSSSTYNDARTGSIAAAGDLFGAGSNQRKVVYKAWRAVGIDPCTLSCPSNIVTANATGMCGKNVTFPATTTTGDCDVVTTVPASGFFFPIGTTTVTSTSTSGQTCTFTVTVNDVEPPYISCPANITQGNDPGQCSAVVSYTALASDNCPGVTLVCNPPSGNVFPVGVTSVSCTATDAHSNTSSCSFTVTVNDVEPPSITCPANITQGNDQGLCSAVVTYTTLASDNCPGMVLVCNPPSGNTFPVGVTPVTCTATDAHGNSSSCAFTVTVNDVEPPTITLSLDPTTLWPPNHKLRNINATVSVTDNCPDPTYVITSIVSNEPDEGLGDGDTPNDIQDAAFGTPDLTFKLRAERSGLGSGRIYTATYTATDGAGNTATASATVTVPKNMSSKALSTLPDRYRLEQNYPNPFNPSTVIRFDIPTPSVVSLRVYNVFGQEVRILVNKEYRDAGQYEVVFDGSVLGSGVYNYRMTATSTNDDQRFTDIRKMILMK